MAGRKRKIEQRRGPLEKVYGGLGGCQANDGTAEKPKVCDEEAVVTVDVAGDFVRMCDAHANRWLRWQRGEEAKQRTIRAIAKGEDTESPEERVRRETEERLGLR